jgi:8-amino-7-oxononanoate synthase
MAAELDALRRDAQFRVLEHTTGVNLCSNDYLGLAADARLKRAIAEGMRCVELVGSTGSRLLSGNSREWEALEGHFAQFAGTEAALYFGSGYAANLGLLSSVLQPGDTVFSDALNHASIIDGIRLSGARKVIFPHLDLNFLEQALREQNSGGARVIVTESVFSMEGDVAPLSNMLALAKQYGAEVIVDEAHATGVWGPQGRGIAAQEGSQREMLAVIHTCGKALASVGAFVCCGAALRDYLINRARTFIFSTAMPPYFAHQIRAALALACAADERRDHLQRVSTFLRQALSALGLCFGSSATQIIPVILGENQVAVAAAKQLQQNGFAIKAVRPPTVPAGTARLRLSLTSRITQEDIASLVAALGKACKG